MPTFGRMELLPKHKVAYTDTHHEKHHSNGHGMNEKDTGKENGKPQEIDRYLLGLPRNPWPRIGFLHELAENRVIHEPFVMAF